RASIPAIQVPCHRCERIPRPDPVSGTRTARRCRCQGVQPRVVSDPPAVTRRDCQQYRVSWSLLPAVADGLRKWLTPEVTIAYCSPWCFLTYKASGDDSQICSDGL